MFLQQQSTVADLDERWLLSVKTKLLGLTFFLLASSPTARSSSEAPRSSRMGSGSDSATGPRHHLQACQADGGCKSEAYAHSHC